MDFALKALKGADSTETKKTDGAWQPQQSMAKSASQPLFSVGGTTFSLNNLHRRGDSKEGETDLFEPVRASKKLRIPKPGSSVSHSKSAALLRTRSSWSGRPVDGQVIRTKEKTWEVLGKADSGAEKPARRHEILELQRKFEGVLERGLRKSSKSNKAKADPVDVYCEQEMVTIRDSVVEVLRNPLRHSRVRRDALEKLFFRQKWTDLIFGELEEHINVSCLEHGQLLRLLRKSLSQVFDEAIHEVTAFCSEVDRAWEKVDELKVKSDSVDQMQEAMYKRFEEEKERMAELLQREHEEECDQLKADVEMSKKEVVKMAETLRSLNSIFKEMQSDTDSVRTADLRNSLSKMEQSLTEKSLELDKLRPLPSQLRRIQEEKVSLEDELIAVKQRLLESEQVLSERNRLAEEVLQAESDRLAAVEVALAEYRNKTSARPDGGPQPAGPPGVSGGGGGGPSVATTSTAPGYQTGPPSAALKDGVVPLPPSGAPPSSTVLCAMCKESLNKAADTSALLNHASNTKEKKLACKYYRLLLPNLIGKRPVGELGWVLHCSRAILYSKMKNDRMNRLSSQPYIRFPEFVYQWFSPSPDALAGLDETQAAEAQERMDVKRWELYYGIKKYMKNHPELYLMWQFLDEQDGTDTLPFALHCFHALFCTVSHDLNWGAGVLESKDYSQLMDHREMEIERLEVVKARYGDLPIDEAVEEEKAAEDPTSKALVAPPPEKPDPAGVPTRVWLDLRDAIACMERLMSSSTEESLVGLKQKMRRKSREAESRLTLEQSIAAALAAGEKPSDDGSVRGMCIDVGSLIQILVKEYRSEQAQRLGAIRLMFTTATSEERAALEAQAKKEALGNNLSTISIPSSEELAVDLAQFSAILTNLNKGISAATIARLYRDSHDQGQGVVCFNSFMKVAQGSHFFVDCLRLPPFYSSENMSLDIVESCSRLSSLVHKHARIMQPVFDEWKKRMCASTSVRFTRLLETLKDELKHDGEGLSCDGRRPYFAFRRVLMYLLNLSVIRTENNGMDWSTVSFYVLEQQLHNVESLVGSSTEAWTLAEKMRGFLSTTRLRLCVRRIQSTWRSRVRANEGVPRMMRPMMSSLYRPRLRHLERPVGWLMSILGMVYRKKIAHDSVCLEHDQLPSTLCEFVYDMHLSQYGVREIAERHIHDLFCTIRQHMGAHLRAHLFGLFCGIGNEEEDKLYAHPSAFAVMRRFLLAINEKLVSSRGPSLFSPSVAGNAGSPCMIPSRMIDNTIKPLCSSLPEGLMNDLMPKLQSAIKRDVVDMDQVLWHCMNAWALDAKSRQQQYRDVISTTDKLAPGARHVICLSAFAQVLNKADGARCRARVMEENKRGHPLTLEINPDREVLNKNLDAAGQVVLGEIDLARLYRTVLQESEKRSPAAIDAKAFMLLGDRGEVGKWRIFGDYVVDSSLSVDISTQFSLLQQAWLPYADPLSELCSVFCEATDRLSEEDTKCHGELLDRVNKILKGVRVDRVAVSDAGQRQRRRSSISYSSISTGWHRLRDVLSELHRCRQIVGTGSLQLRDSWDD